MVPKGRGEKNMFEIGYKAKTYYRDSEGVRILLTATSKAHYPTEEEALRHGEAELPPTMEIKGQMGYRCEIIAKAFKYETDVCPDGYCVCPRCYGSGVYDAPSNWTDSHGVKYCFKCNGLGIIKQKKERR